MKLPIGIQTFSKIREEGMVYIDKTKNIHSIITSAKYLFLSRPRRFGKSLLLSTLASLYEGRKDLFEGLWIADHWDWTQQYTILNLQFSSQGLHTLGASQAILHMLGNEAKRLGISLESTTYDVQFKELIRKAAEKSPTKKVVILVDEYDKPIIDYLDDLPQAQANRQILKNFYSVLKDSDAYIELLFVTGVSRFAKTSIFSDLNHILNLTLDFDAVQLLGITHEEILQYFKGKLEGIAQEKGISTAALLAQLKYWYNGYSWDGINKVYNPFSLLNFMRSGQFHDYWFESGTPTFLIKRMEKAWLYNVGKVTASHYTLDTFELEDINPITLLFQAGYITIREKIANKIYELEYPNQEVKIALEDHLYSAYAHDGGNGQIKALNLSKAFKSGDIAEAITIINAIFAEIPAPLWQKENEAYYHSLIHLTFSLMGIFVQSEIYSVKGRLDAKVETADTIYILEFKINKSAAAALQQITDKGYFDAYMDSPKKRIGIGINFSKEKKAVQDWEMKTF